MGREGQVPVDAEALRQIFESFFTTKNDEEPTGLRLAIAYGIVQHGDGELDVENVPGSGPTFRIDLPRADPEPDPAWEHARARARKARPEARPPWAVASVVYPGSPP